VSASENQVLSGQTRHLEETSQDGKVTSKGSFIDELTLKNCNIKLSSLDSSSVGKIKLSFSDRVFVADEITFTTKPDGECVVTLINGHGVK